MSRWFVGSSSNKRCGLYHTCAEKASRAFCPPDSVPNFCFAMAPKPKLAKYAKRSSSLATLDIVVFGSWLGSRAGSTPRIQSTQLSVRCSSSLSRWCCETWAIFSFGCRRALFSGHCSPSSHRSRVVFPAPLVPTTATRLFGSKVSVTFLRMVRPTSAIAKLAPSSWRSAPLSSSGSGSLIFVFSSSASSFAASALISTQDPLWLTSSKRP
mmetsp:Transcript_68022/g.189980  ORF Transcript_68022/g.189980 Transcript_68022/m.189980 type:complete len:211 (+) Transcript_68022:590-1222(+)